MSAVSVFPDVSGCLIWQFLADLWLKRSNALQEQIVGPQESMQAERNQEVAQVIPWFRYY